MNLFRNILTAIWCAVIIGTNVFSLIVVLRMFGTDVVTSPELAGPVLKMSLMAGFGLLSLISTKYLWAVLAIAVASLLLGLSYEVLVQRSWRPVGMLGGLLEIVPTYLLARWNTAARKSDFNPVKEF